MLAPNSSDLLRAWDGSLARSPAARPLTYLECLASNPPDRGWKHIPIGLRDARLLDLQEQTFGSQLHCLSDCPSCRTTVEFSLPVQVLRRPVPAESAVLEMQDQDTRVSFRLPDTSDLMEIDEAPDEVSAARQLFARCLVSASRADGTPIPAHEIPDETVTRISEQMATADAQADVVVTLVCPECQHTWESPFDIALFFGIELHAWARRTLREIHELASAYGWSESEILHVSPSRRQAYLDMVRS